jgi:hypothetical protein
MPLNEALDRALRVYDQERLHPAPVEVVASGMGYKSANNGSALSAIASLRYYGLLERPKDGYLAVTKNVELYKYTPSDWKRKQLLIEFLKSPPLYADLIEQYASGLPSDATIKYDLIQRGFIPSGAESALSCFKQSVQFAAYFDQQVTQRSSTPDDDLAEMEEADSYTTTTAQLEAANDVPAKAVIATIAQPDALNTVPAKPLVPAEEEDLDRYPVRLPGGRKAWLLIPTVFYEADKTRLKAQIDLLLTEDEQ